jgi:hypothetical protein
MPKVRMDHRLRVQLSAMQLVMTHRFCSEFDVIVEVETEEDARAILFAAMLAWDGDGTEPHRID